MRDEHIISLLENAPLASLNESELKHLRAHIKLCDECGRAYEAAQISALLIKERAAETFEPSPFFQTRVMAALRERQANQISPLKRLWNATGALVSSMAATVALLAVLTFFMPATQTTAQQETATAINSYSAEGIIFEEDEPQAEPISDGQVLTTLYAADEETAR